MGRVAVLFDFDGVLADTMGDNLKAWQTVFGDIGFRVDPREYLLLEGLSVREIARTFSKRFGLAAGDDRVEYLLKKKEEIYASIHEFKLYSGVPETISLLSSHGIPMALVTGGQYERVKESMPPELFEKFSVVITPANGGRGKLYPDPFLNAARALCVDIKDCVVVENAPLGIRSAKAAGAYCVAICSTLPREALCEADEIVDEFKDFLALLTGKTPYE